jgi:hypothetical protein
MYMHIAYIYRTLTTIQPRHFKTRELIYLSGV